MQGATTADAARDRLRVWLEHIGPQRESVNRPFDSIHVDELVYGRSLRGWRTQRTLEFGFTALAALKQYARRANSVVCLKIPVGPWQVQPQSLIELASLAGQIVRARKRTPLMEPPELLVYSKQQTAPFRRWLHDCIPLDAGKGLPQRPGYVIVGVAAKGGVLTVVDTVVCAAMPRGNRGLEREQK